MHLLVQTTGTRPSLNHWPIATIRFLIYKSVNLLKRNKLYFTLLTYLPFFGRDYNFTRSLCAKIHLWAKIQGVYALIFSKHVIKN